jgi:hypothetical protein
MTFLLSLLFSGKRILSAVWAWCSANPARLAIVVLIALCGFLALSNASLRGDVRHKDKVIAALRDASKKATVAQIAMNADRTKKETTNANQSDERYIAAQDVSGIAAIRYIDRWRVRPNSSCSGPNTPTENGSAEIPAEMPSNPVLVSERDVQACTGATAYAIEAHNHAVSQIAAGLAVPVQ